MYFILPRLINTKRIKIKDSSAVLGETRVEASLKIGKGVLGIIMESYIVRIYRSEKNKPRSLVGTVEEVGVEEKRAFTNLEELWNILNSIKSGPVQSKKSGIHISAKYEIEKRLEDRTKKEIPFVFTHNKHNLKASTVNFCKNGLCVKVLERIPLTVGEIANLKIRKSSLKAEVRWVNSKSDPSVTSAGFQIKDGRLNLKGTGKADAS